MNFRIGINLGDVMLEGDDVYGDGVNIAARLQELAEPGGILISGPVYDQVHNKLSIGFERLGEQSLKNVAHPVTGYRVLQGGAPPRPQAPPPEPMRTPPARSRRRRVRPCSRLGLVHGPASRQRRADRHHNLLVRDQRVQRPPRNLVSMARRGAAVDRLSASREGARTVVGKRDRLSAKASLGGQKTEPIAARRTSRLPP